MRSSIVKSAGLLLLIGGVGLCLQNTSRSAATESSGTVPSQLARDLIGTWILVGEPGAVSEAPATGGRLKFFTGSHWCITQANPTNGVTIYHHGGTYTLTGDQYAETVGYANESTKSLIKKTFKFTVKIEGDMFTQIGISNSWTEVWKRVE
jgi:hypothetical protein